MPNGVNRWALFVLRKCYNYFALWCGHTMIKYVAFANINNFYTANPLLLIKICLTLPPSFLKKGLLT